MPNSFLPGAGSIWEQVAAGAAGNNNQLNRADFNLPGYQQRADSLDFYQQQNQDPRWAAGQHSLAEMLMRQAQGQDSYSAEQLRQNLGRNVSAQQAMVAGAAPSRAAMASRIGAQQASMLGAGLAGQQALAGIQERNAAANALGGVLGQGRGQDIQAYLGAGQLGLGNAQAQQQGGIQYGAQQTSRYAADQGVKAAEAGQPQQPGMGETAGYIVGGPGGAMAGRALGSLFSDRRLKENITPGGGSADDLLQTLSKSGAVYSYKPETGLPGGQRLGVMAQDVERVAPGAVQDTPGGKTIDYVAMLPALAAALGRLNQKVEARNAPKDARGRSRAPLEGRRGVPVQGRVGIPNLQSMQAVDAQFKGKETPGSMRRNQTAFGVPPNIPPMPMTQQEIELANRMRQIDEAKRLYNRGPNPFGGESEAGSTLSDVRLKQNIRPGGGMADKLLGMLSGKFSGAPARLMLRTGGQYERDLAQRPSYRAYQALQNPDPLAGTVDYDPLAGTVD